MLQGAWPCVMRAATVVVLLASVGQSRLCHGCSKKALTRRRAITFAPLKSSNEVET